jgi:hypothetical protein
LDVTSITSRTILTVEVESDQDHGKMLFYIVLEPNS